MEEKLSLYLIDPKYLKYMHSIDSRVSVKNSRPFVGIITMINGVKYVLPLTSQTTAERKKEGKNKRASQLTTFVKDSSDQEIANILHNNMFPVVEGTYTLLSIDPQKDTYESNEIRYIRKNKESIIRKAKNVYEDRTTNTNAFLNKTCCDFRRLENGCAAFSVSAQTV